MAVSRAHISKWLAILGGLFLIWITMLSFIQRKLLFPIGQIELPTHDVARRIDGLERVDLQTEVGAVEAWFIPGDGASAQAPQPLVIYFHGNGSLIDFVPEELVGYRKAGVSLALLEYRGYGRSPGKPSQEVLVKDATAFFDLMAARPDVDAARISLHGRSLGGGVACALAAERPPKALVLENTFRSFVAMTAQYWLPRFLVADPFDSETTIKRFTGPVVMFHGRQDTLIDFSHAEALRDAAPNATLHPFDGTHNDRYPDSADYWRWVLEAVQ